MRVLRIPPIHRATKLKLASSHCRFIHSSRVSNQKKNDGENSLTGQKYDEAELMSGRLNKEPYYAKRQNVDDFYEQKQQGDEQGPSSDDELKRHQRIEVIKGLLAGVCTIGGIVGGYALWTEWPSITAWWYSSGDDPIIKKKKKSKFELPVITNKNDSTVPGLYVWGDNSNGISSMDKKVGEVRTPIRHDWFDGKVLRSVVLGETSAFAIDDKGDLIQWGKGFNVKNPFCPQFSVKGEGLTMAKFSNGQIYALNKKHEIIVIPEQLEEQASKSSRKKSSWFRSSNKPFTKLSTALAKDEHFASLDCGKDHLIALTNKGRVFTSSTSPFSNTTKSQGQFGIPEYSHLSKSLPPLNTLQEIILLNQHIQRTARGKIDHIEPRRIVKVACGNYHTLALDANGEVYSFGQNTYGQCAHPVSYELEFINVPKKIELFARHIRRDMFPEVLDIQAGGDTSFATVKPVHMYQLIKSTMGDHKLDRLNDEESFVVGFGKDLKGQIGNNLFIHAQFTPVKLNELTKYEDYNTERDEMERVGIEEWSSGQDHTFIKMANSDVLYWGGNDCGQLGNGKRNRIAKPTSPPALVEPHFTLQTYKDLTFVNRLQLSQNQHIVAGENNSAIYYTN